MPTPPRPFRSVLAVVTACGFLVASCGGESGGSSTSPDSTGAPATSSSSDQVTTTAATDPSVASSMRAVMTEQVIPAHRDLVAAALALAATVETSCETDLAAVQAAFRPVRLAWDAARVYQLGPHVDRRLLASVDWWPVDEEDVEAVAAGDAPMTAEELELLGSKTRGLRVIEYLLWADTPPTGRRCSYVQRAAESIADKATAVADEFEATVENFATSPTAVEDFLGALAQALYVLCDADLGMPSGANVRNPVVDVSLVRQGGAGMAIEDVKAQLGEVEQAYTTGILPIVEARYPGEPDLLADPLEQAVISVDLLGPDLVTAIENAPDFVKGAANACRDLRRNLILTVAGQLGVVLELPVGDGD